MSERQIAATAAHEAFYAEALTAVAEAAKRHGNHATVIELIAVLSVAVGRMICACYPNERDLALAAAIKNMKHEIATMAQGSPTEMTRQ